MSSAGVSFGVILPIVIVIGWILSWRWSRLRRWGLLGAGAVVSAICLVIGLEALGRASGLFWVPAGALGIECVIVLAVVTTVVDAVLWWRARPHQS